METLIEIGQSICEDGSLCDKVANTTLLIFISSVLFYSISSLV